MTKSLLAARARAVSPLRLLIVAGYVGLTVAVTLLALGESSLFTPAGVAAILLAPLAIVAVFLGDLIIGMPWMLGLTDADPDNSSDSWIYALGALIAVVNAGLYLWLVVRYRQRHA